MSMRRMKLHVRFLTYYLLFLLVPIAAATVMYVQLADVVLDQEVDTNLKLLRKATDTLDSQLFDLEKLF